MGQEYTFQNLESDDVAQHLELMRNVFGRNSRVDLQVEKWINYHPTMTLQDFFVAKHEGKIVAGLNLIPSKWNMGGIQLKVAQLAYVATLPEYRHRGLQRRLMAEYHKRVVEEGYDLSAIEGVPYYYRQFGYEYALPLLEETRISLDKIPDHDCTGTIRPCKRGDVPKAMKLMAEAQQKFFVHSVRDEGIWKMHEESGMVAEYGFEEYVVEENGSVIAYFKISENPENKELFLREITDVDRSTAWSILRFLGDLGRKRMLETFVATISHHEFFAQHLMAIGEAQQSKPYAWQIRVTDHASIFRKMKSLFEKRLSASAFRCLTERLNFGFYRYAVQMRIESGEVTDVQRLDVDEDRSIRFNPLVFTQLLLGYRSRDELETIYPDMLVKTSHKRLVDVLFPKLPSYIHTDY